MSEKPSYLFVIVGYGLAYANEGTIKDADLGLQGTLDALLADGGDIVKATLAIDPVTYEVVAKATRPMQTDIGQTLSDLGMRVQEVGFDDEGV